MYIYDRSLSGVQSAVPEQFRSHLSGFGAQGVSKSSTQKETIPKWLEDGVRQGRWSKEAAAGLWALRKIARDK